MTTPDVNNEYINTLEYKNVSKKIKDVVSVMDTWAERNTAAGKLRYAELDIEVERAAGRLAPDEVFVPQHIMDANIRREQASYIQYITQSNRVCILQDLVDPTIDTSSLERDLTNKLRYNDWQLDMYPNIDGMQQNGYGIIETLYDPNLPGNLKYEFVRLGDLGFSIDTKDIQEAEFVIRNYYFSKTKLLEMSSPDSEWEFNPEQTKRVTDGEPTGIGSDVSSSTADRSLYKIQKVMFRVKGFVYVGWTCEGKCEDWLREPRQLFLGRQAAIEQPQVMILSGQPAPVTYSDEYETKYPYTIFPYVISENDTINKLCGRAFLDQETQVAVTSLMSSICTAYRRASGLYFSKNTEDPNDDILLQKNVQFKTGCLINSKVQSFQLQYPDPSALGAVQALVSANQSETSKVNFAAQNRKDSRKTATEIEAATQEAAQLSTVQVVLYSSSLKKLYEHSFYIIQSRVAAGLIKVNDQLKMLYARKYSIRPAGDIDVIERQQLVGAMRDAWPVMQQTPAATLFLSDMLRKMFPDGAAKYITVIEQAQATQQSAQAQQQQQLLQAALGVGKQIMEISQRPEMFSDTGKVHVLPKIQEVAQQLSTIIKPNQV